LIASKYFAGGLPVYVVESLFQLEIALLKDEIAELLIVNWLAVQIYKAMIGERTFFYE